MNFAFHIFVTILQGYWNAPPLFTTQIEEHSWPKKQMYVPIVFIWLAYDLVYTSEALFFNLFGWIYHIWPCFYHIVLIMIAWNII